MVMKVIAPQMTSVERRSMLRRAAERIRMAVNMTAEERADAYVARLPISVLGP